MPSSRGWIGLALCLGLAQACVVQTEQLEGEHGERGERGEPGEPGDQGEQGLPGMVDATELMSAVADTGTTGSVTIDGQLVVASNGGTGVSSFLGAVGIGTAAPSAPLEVLGADGSTALSVGETSPTMASRQLLYLQNNGGALIEMTNSAAVGGRWRLGVTGSVFRILDPVTLGEVTISPAGDVTLTGDLTVSGMCTGCDAVFERGYPIPTIASHAEQMWMLGHLPAVGSTPERGQMNLRQKIAGMLNELEKAHIYIARLDQRLRDEKQRSHRLEQRLEALEQRVAAMR